ncbi:MAG: lytic transglycosylase domain-containing protein [Bryobacteraceae bacterium]
MKSGLARVFLLSLAACCVVEGAVLVHLRNGTEIEARSQATSGDDVSLAVDRGTIEIASSEIESIETVPDDLASPNQNKPQDILSVAEALKRASDSEALPPNFVKTVATVESGLHPDAISPKGAVGLMQLMPGTANQLGVKADSPTENALGGAKYLRDLLLRYRGDARLALAAYNAGPAAVDRYHGIPPYPETISYINKVLKEYERLERASAPKTGNSSNRTRIERN